MPRKWIWPVAVLIVAGGLFFFSNESRAPGPDEASLSSENLDAADVYKERASSSEKKNKAPTVVPRLPASFAIPLSPDKPGGYKNRLGKFRKPLRQDLRRIRFRQKKGAVYSVALLGGGTTESFPEVDLGALVPHLHPVARKSPELTRLALSQQELNREQTRYPKRSDGSTLWLANNCLKCGLWEVGLNVEQGGTSLTTFHAWFNFPRDVYAGLFEHVNEVAYESVQQYLLGYPELKGFEIPLPKLRSVLRSDSVTTWDLHGKENVAKLKEQRKKAPLLLTSGMDRYKDWYAEKRQPVLMSKFQEPGFYDNDDPMKFDLNWLKEVQAVELHKVQSKLPQERSAQTTGARSPAKVWDATEIEVRFASGPKVLLAHEAISKLPVRKKAPAEEAEVLRLTFGIGTPLIYADARERSEERAKEPLQYLLLLDDKGQHLDNHAMGLDRVYLWRDAKEMHLWLVGYERIALVGHISFPYPRSTSSPSASQ